MAAPEAEPDVVATAKPTVVGLFHLDPDDEAEGGETPDAIAGTAQPTVANVFRQPGSVTPMPTPVAGRVPSAGPQTTPLVLNGGDSRPEVVSEIMIYDDVLDANWSLVNSTDVEYDIQDTTQWFTVMDERMGIDSGAMSIAVTPEADLASLFFTVNEDASVRYPRDQILAISFWLNSGLRVVETGDIAVTVVGSNQNTYWTADDFSVFQSPNETFSETALHYLDINRSIPPETWVNVVVWLDELQFDPNYANITGFYIKSDIGFRSTYYVDKLALVTAQ